MKIEGKKVLITGGGGFIASHLTHRLFNLGAKIFIITKYNSVIDNIRLIDIWDKINIVEADIRNTDPLRIIKKIKPHIIFHMAAYNHVGDSFFNYSEAIDTNGKGTFNLLEAYDEYEKFIYISSSEVYGFQKKLPFTENNCAKPISPYAIGKFAGDLYCQIKIANGYPIVILRPFNTFGPYQSPRAIIAEVIIKALKGEPIYATKGEQTREFNYVSNIIDAFILAAENDEAIGKIINIGSGEEISIKELILMIHKLTNSNSKLYIGKLPYRPTEIWKMSTSNKLAKDILGWEPKIKFIKGLKLTINWYKEFLKIYNNSNSPLYYLANWNDNNRVGHN